MVIAQAPGESNGVSGSQARRATAIPPTFNQELLAERRVSIILGVQISLLGGKVHGQVVHENHALEDRADEESGAHATQSS